MTAPRIRRLPQSLINQIAAGEVVERPASVVKEFMENAIDAAASRIEVTLEDGGKRLIRVSDDGVGMAPDDLRLAFESHATSKLETPDDLFDVDTFGFRGEALASIGAISRARIVSRARGSATGAEIECIAGTLGELRECGAPEGTLVEARTLFFNTPARLKFLRSTATELRHVAEAVTRLALPHPALSVRLTHNGRSVLKLDPCDTPRQRLRALWGGDLADRLLAVQGESSAMALTGFASPPGDAAPSPIQYVFLNGRYIRDRAIQRAITEAYRNRLRKGGFPAVALFLQMDPHRVDVNVHPTKIEVRFHDSGAVFAQVLTALDRALGGASPVPEALPAAEPAAQGERVRQALSEFLQRAPQADRRGTPHHAPPFRRETPPQAAPPPSQGAPLPPPPPTPAMQSAPAPLFESAPAAPPPAMRVCFQLHNAYLVEQVSDGFLLIDQHALHERILFEDLQRRVAQAAVPRQRLLIPEVIELRPQDFLRVMELKDDLLKLGVEVAAFGERTVAVHAVPHLARAVSGRELLAEILAAEDPSASAAERSDRMLRTIACKAAVKAGDRLSRVQIEALLEQRDRLGPEPTCPHGRPTTLRFALSDLEKRFQRS